jgi:hypothetical protein
MDKGQLSTPSWKTGTSAASWRLRSQGRYKEADDLLTAKAKEGDAEALFTLWSLGYPGGAAEAFFCSGGGGSKLLLLDDVARKGHPLAMAMAPKDNGGTWRYIRDSGCAMAILLYNGDNPELYARVLAEGTPDELWILFSREFRGHTPALRRELHQKLVFTHHHPIAAAAEGAFHPFTTHGFIPRYTADGAHRTSDAIGRDVASLEIAARQGHAVAIDVLAHFHLDPNTPPPFCNCAVGAGWLVQSLLCEARRESIGASVGTAGPSKAAALLAPRLDDVRYTIPITGNRLRELYLYGQSWPRFLRADKACSSSRKDHPLRVYEGVMEAARDAVYVFIMWLRFRRPGYVDRWMPYDVVKMIARLVWCTREEYIEVWWRAANVLSPSRPRKRRKAPGK